MIVVAQTQKRTFAAAWATTFLINVAWGIIFPLRNIYIHDQGVSLVLIGTLSTAGAIAFSISGVAIGRLSDVIGKRRQLIFVLLPLAALVSLVYLTATQFIHFLLLVLLDMFLIGGYVVVMDTLVSSILSAENRGGGFGWYRISGSLGFALSASLLGILTANFGIRVIFVLSAGALLVATLFATLMSDSSEPQTTAAKAMPGQGAGWAGVIASVFAGGLAWFILAGLISALGSEMAHPFLNIYVHDALGATEGQIGTIATIGVLAEIPTMLLLGRLSDRYGRGPVLVTGFVATALSWLLVFQAVTLTPIYVSRILAGMSIIRYTVGVALISDRIPATDRATLIGMTNLSFGVGGFIGPTLGGVVIERTSTRFVFAVAFVINVIASLLYLLQIGRKQPRQRQVTMGHPE